MTTTVIPTQAEIDARIAKAKAAGKHHIAALYEGLAMGVELMLVPRDKAPLIIPERPRNRGLVIVLGDDFVTAEGPAAFHLRTLRQLAARANAWAVMSGAPLVPVYEAATVVARTGPGAMALIVETQESEERTWVQYLMRHGRKNAAKLLVSPNVKAA